MVFLVIYCFSNAFFHSLCWFLCSLGFFYPYFLSRTVEGAECGLQGGKSAQITVEVISSPEQFVWQITKNRDVSIYYSVSEVIKFLNIIR